MKQLIVHRIVIIGLVAVVAVLWFRQYRKSESEVAFPSLDEIRDDLKKREYRIKFDAEMNEYHLVYSSTNADAGRSEARALLRYDPFTGARLPESKRASYFHQPDSGEIAIVTARLRTATTIEAVRAALGEPDAVDGPLDTMKQQLTYSHLAKTLDVIVQESTNGELSIMYVPKYKGTNSQ